MQSQTNTKFDKQNFDTYFLMYTLQTVINEKIIPWFILRILKTDIIILIHIQIETLST